MEAPSARRRYIRVAEIMYRGGRRERQEGAWHVDRAGLCALLIATNYTCGLLGLFEFALLLATVTIVVGYAFATAAHAVLIRRQPGRWGGADARRSVVVSSLALLYSCFVIVWSGWEPISWGAVLLAGALLLYSWSVRRYRGPAFEADVA